MCFYASSDSLQGYKSIFPSSTITFVGLVCFLINYTPLTQPTELMKFCFYDLSSCTLICLWLSRIYLQISSGIRPHQYWIIFLVIRFQLFKRKWTGQPIKGFISIYPRVYFPKFEYKANLIYKRFFFVCLCPRVMIGRRFFINEQGDSAAPLVIIHTINLDDQIPDKISVLVLMLKKKNKLFRKL